MTNQDDKALVRRGDSFDIGIEKPYSPEIIDIFQNPTQLTNLLSLTESQADNIRSLVVGAGAGGIHRLLSQHLGDEVAGMLGGFIAGHISRKVFGGR